ncbi:heterokaryon incompatibility [Diplodia corticola]|uniref:Heterokaryon incompatibility n=1 Tax=Diplodia corticola TaxID=236234 RepID=A0A1J9RZF3_9PEZI|nr:heterokaryon incompatibility [Diplodia corticola]OJD33727.1 heterokaryon incompatibility [Diplodia corticola]
MIRKGQYARVQSIEIGSKKLAPDQARSLLEAESFIPETIRWERIRAPLLEAAVAPEPLDPPPTGFRLIDVEKCCVVKAPKTFEYVALSYIWGDATLNSKFLHLSLSNSRDLEEQYSLQGPGIPATVQDAMAACRGLGKRYLWVDRFCIPQDEHNNPTKKAQINVMGRIYSHAVLVLVALEGDSDSGLPGVSKLRCKPRYKTQFSGREFWETNTSTWQFLDEVHLSKWSSRGWTFQENFLAAKVLFFTKDGLVGEYSDTRMFFESEPPAEVPMANYESRSRGINDKYGFCQLAAYEASRREFGKDSDILNAIAGVLDACGEHRFGIPLQGFDDFLTWTVISPLERRESTNEHIFPTWSWASVRGQMVPANLETVPLATFGFPKGHQSNTPCLDPCWPRHLKFDRCGNLILAAAIACQTGCLKTPLPELLQPTKVPRSFGDFAQDFKRSYPTFMSLWKAMHGMEQNHSPLQNFLNEFSTAQVEMALKPGRVLALAQVTTPSIVLKSVYDPQSPDLPFGRVQIFFGESDVGRINLDTEQDVRRLVLVDDTMLGKGRWPAMSSEQDVRSNTDPYEIDFLALVVFFQGSRTEETPTAVTDRFTFDDGSRPVTNFFITALAMETNAGISRRLGVAYFRLENWLKLPRGCKAVVLE